MWVELAKARKCLETLIMFILEKFMWYVLELIGLDHFWDNLVLWDVVDIFFCSFVAFAFDVPFSWLCNLTAATLIKSKYLHLIVFLDLVYYEVIAWWHMVFLIIKSGQKEANLSFLFLYSLLWVLLLNIRCASCFFILCIHAFLIFNLVLILIDFVSIMILDLLELSTRLQRYKPFFINILLF